MDDVIEQKRDVMPLAWVPKGGEKRAAKGAGRVRGSQEAPANGAKGGKKTLDEAAMTPFLREITLVSSGGAFLDGYVLSLIGVALTQITAQMSLTTHWTAAIGASVLLGILVGSIVGGYLTDIIGRKKMFVLDIIAIALFSALSMTDATPMQLVIYRFFIGVFVGHRHVAHHRIHAEAPSRDLHGHGLGGVVPRRHRGGACGLLPVRRRQRVEADARVGHHPLRVPADRQMQGSRVPPVA